MSIREKVATVIDRVVKAMEPTPTLPLAADGPWRNFTLWRYDGNQEAVARFLNWIELQGFDPRFVYYDSGAAPAEFVDG